MESLSLILESPLTCGSAPWRSSWGIGMVHLSVLEVSWAVWRLMQRLPFNYIKTGIILLKWSVWVVKLWLVWECFWNGFSTSSLLWVIILLILWLLELVIEVSCTLLIELLLIKLVAIDIDYVIVRNVFNVEFETELWLDPFRLVVILYVIVVVNVVVKLVVLMAKMLAVWRAEWLRAVVSTFEGWDHIWVVRPLLLRHMNVSWLRGRSFMEHFFGPISLLGYLLLFYFEDRFGLFGAFRWGKTSWILAFKLCLSKFLA